VEATFRPLTAEKGLDFSVRVSPELPVTLHTDEQRLLQVLRNLLSNAVKFTDSGSVELVIRPAGAEVPQSIKEQLLEAGTMREPDQPLIAFSVTDTGIGIAATKMRVIFEAFKQADGTTSRKYGGTGLGLSISREIARLLGGEIHADSQPGRGSTFTLYLPLSLGEFPQALPQLPAGGHGGDFEQGSSLGRPRSPGSSLARLRRRSAQPLQLPDGNGHSNGSGPSYGGGQSHGAGPSNGSAPYRGSAHSQPGSRDHWQDGEHPDAYTGFSGGFSGEKVLIVDDDIRNVFALTSVLEQHGLTVLYAENGREGIEVLEQHDDIAVVLMDIMMPEMDGYATTTAVRKMPQFAGLPIIALTAKAMKGDREKAIESGASDYVTKPVDTDHLLTLMEEWMHAR
jgi:CheY-like chemotaxis protein